MIHYYFSIIKVQKKKTPNETLKNKSHGETESHFF